MNATSVPIVVVIPTAGRPVLLRRTLDSLARCTRPARYRHTLVVENGPPHGARELVAGYPDALRFDYLYSPPPNKSRALNCALDAVDGNALVLFTDDDARFDPRWIAAYADASEGRRRGVMYGGAFGVDYEQRPAARLVPYLPDSARGRTAWDFGGGRFQTLLGINWAAFADDLRAAGGFDERRGPGLAMGGQEFEMQLRMHRAGVRQQLVPGTLVWHYVPAERCSPAWLLRHRYRAGVSMGRARMTTRDPRRRADVLIRGVGDLVWKAVRELAPVDGPPNLFGARVHLTMAWGMVVGAWREARGLYAGCRTRAASAHRSP